MGGRDFTKTHTLTAKGGAILLMLFHHLFMYPGRIRGSGYQPIFYLWGRPFVVYVAMFANICVGMYIFLSGFGLAKKCLGQDGLSFRSILKVLKHLLFQYWLVFFLFVPMGFMFFGRVFQWREFLENLFCLRFSYNGEWWFMSLYVELLLILPLWKKFLDSGLMNGMLGTTLFLGAGLCGKWAASFLPALLRMRGSGFAGNAYLEVINFLLWQFVFSLGYLAARYGLYEKLKDFLAGRRLDRRWFYAAVIGTVIAVRQLGYGGKRMDLVLAPVFTLAFADLCVGSRLRRLLVFFGRHSTNLWLIHSFFCYTYFAELVYVLKYPVLVYPWFLLLTVAASCAMEKINQGICFGYTRIKGRYYNWKRKAGQNG